MTQETFTFQTEVGRLLDIVAHSLYSHKEIFLRELISNASDACDRLRYAAITDPSLIVGGDEFKIVLVADNDAGTLSVIDNGVGMDRQDLLDTLGTIARSGTQAFVSQLTGDAKKDNKLIGQFGVGFYSAFMVAERVEVLTRKAGDETAWRWISDGKGSFTIDEDQRESRGTTVFVHVKEDAREFLESHRLRSIVKKYSDHVGFPIMLKEDNEEKTVNDASSLWTRPKADITEEQYKEFYHHVGHAFDDPWLVMHNTVEGVISYTNLLVVPSTPGFDMYSPERKSRVKLYVKRVFITDECEGLVPAYLRFLRGVVDSEDLPLNISRDTFQHDPRLTKIRSGLVKRVLDALATKAEKELDAYASFWNNFGAVLKEGIYEDYENRDRLIKLSRFHSTASNGLTSLDGYIERMKEGQEAIFFISGEQLDSIRRSPQLEGFHQKGVEVLLLTDPVDEFWIPSVGVYESKPFKSAAAAGPELSKIKGADAEASADAKAPASDDGSEKLLGALKTALGSAVKDVRASERLTESAVCLIADEGDIDMYLERMLRQHRQLESGAATPRVLEVNLQHPVVVRLADRIRDGKDGKDPEIADAAFLLLDQARILEGEPVSDPLAFAKRLSNVMAQGLAAG